MSLIDTATKTISIYASSTHADYFEVEMPYWIYLYPRDSTSFNIKVCNYLHYAKTFEIYVRAIKVKDGKRRKSPYPSRKVIRLKASYRKFAVNS
jgi:hypothetical protein